MKTTKTLTTIEKKQIFNVIFQCIFLGIKIKKNRINKRVWFHIDFNSEHIYCCKNILGLLSIIT